MFKSSFYKFSSKSIQEILISARTFVREYLRTGRIFQQTLAEIERSQWFDTEQLQTLQLQKMQAQLSLVATHSQFYKTWLRNNSLQNEDFRTLVDFQKLPFLDKKILRNNFSELIANQKGGFKIYSSGSTGTPIAVLQNLAAVSKENAFVWRQLAWAGYKSGQKRAWIHGEMIVPIAQTKPPFWRYNATAKMLMFSSYHLSETNAIDYLNALVEFDPVLLQGLPSSIVYLARVLESQGQYYRGKSLSSVIVSSETLTEEAYKLISERFRCQVFDWYGSTERVVAIGTCEQGRRHIISDYGYFETVITDTGNLEIVGSSFNNQAMPLLRYKSGDIIELETSNTPCECKRCFPLVHRVLGRMDDGIKFANGVTITSLDYIFHGLTQIAEAQIVQKDLNSVEIRLVSLENFNDKNKRQLLENARRYMGNDIGIELVFFEKIPRGANGKFKNIVSNLADE